MEEFERILNPSFALEDNEKMLIDYYASIYGSKYKNLIKDRTDSTIYIFESKPEYTFKFLLENQDKISDFSQLEYVEKQAKDYSKLELDLNTKLQLDVYFMFCDYHNIDAKKNSNNFDIILQIADEMTTNYEKYCLECNCLGIKPINDSKIISDFLQKKRKKIQLKDKELFFQSIWGKRIKQSFLEMGLSIDDNILYHIFDIGGADGRCLNHPCGLKFVYVPTIQLYCQGYNVDSAFLHENRHVVEAGEDGKCIGISPSYDKFTLLNEIRTEKNAIEDFENLPTLFSRKSSNDDNVTYRFLFPFCADFFEEYQFLLDMCAIENNISLLESIFGREALSDYDNLLVRIFATIENNLGKGNLKIICSYLDKIERLKENAQASGYFDGIKLKLK